MLPVHLDNQDTEQKIMKKTTNLKSNSWLDALETAVVIRDKHMCLKVEGSFALWLEKHNP